MGLGEGIDKFYLTGILVRSGHRFDMFLQAGYELAGWMEAGLPAQQSLDKSTP